MKEKLKGLIRGFLAQSQIHIMQMWKWKQNEDGGKEFGDECGAWEWSEKASVCVRQMWFTEAQHWLKLQQGSRSILHPHPPSPSFALYSLTLSLTVSRALTEVFLRVQTGAELQSDSSLCVCMLCTRSSAFLLFLEPFSSRILVLSPPAQVQHTCGS